MKFYGQDIGSRLLIGTPWVKLEVIGDDETLQPDVVGLVEAADVLIRDGFEVFPYCTEDLTVVGRLIDVGCQVVMPWASPIGSAKAADPVAMARAFKLAVEAGRLGFEAGLMEPRDFASPSTPVVGTPFWHAAS